VQFVDIAITDAVLAVSERMIWQHSTEGVIPGPEGNHHPFLIPFGMFPAADGFITVAAQQDAFFAILVEGIGAEWINRDPRFSTSAQRVRNRLALIDILSRETVRFTKAELTARLGGKIPFGPVMNIAEIEKDQHFISREMIVEVDDPGKKPVRIAGVPLKMTLTPGAVRRRAPLLGEHTRIRLKEAGLSDEEIDLLIERREAAQFQKG
jgi:crotonobetainyl-CoA:carnitine CoA-transferase CaiB-like acyl-CoA transferase